ncbi:MAG: arsenate reductase family protein [Methanosarcinaceae archaeon]|nr:arsenate reductase family protein [Methanosarcinaceae archaeon]
MKSQQNKQSGEVLFICYKRCGTCRKAKKWLEDNSISYIEREIDKVPPTEEELKNWIPLSNLPLKRFFNTSGQIYRSENIKDKLPNMSEDEQIKLLSTSGMLVKRPILIKDDTVLVGFKEDEWTEKLLN